MDQPDNFIPHSLASNSPAPNPPSLTQLGAQPSAVEPAGVGQQQQQQQQQRALDQAPVAVPRGHLAGPLGGSAVAQDIQYQTNNRVITSQQQQSQAQAQVRLVIFSYLKWSTPPLLHCVALLYRVLISQYQCPWHLRDSLIQRGDGKTQLPVDRHNERNRECW